MIEFIIWLVIGWIVNVLGYLSIKRKFPGDDPVDEMCESTMGTFFLGFMMTLITVIWPAMLAVYLSAHIGLWLRGLKNE